MRKLVLVVALAASSLPSGEAWATLIHTTLADVHKQCGGKNSCDAKCGSTSCNYVCSKNGNCTVLIN